MKSTGELLGKIFLPDKTESSIRKKLSYAFKTHFPSTLSVLRENLRFGASAAVWKPARWLWAWQPKGRKSLGLITRLSPWTNSGMDYLQTCSVINLKSITVKLWLGTQKFAAKISPNNTDIVCVPLVTGSTAAGATSRKGLGTKSWNTSPRDSSNLVWPK